MASQATLRELWLQGPEERLCGREQAKAWALREVWVAEGKGAYGLCTLVASKVRKTKNGKPTGPPPTQHVGSVLGKSLESSTELALLAHTPATASAVRTHTHPPLLPPLCLVMPHEGQTAHG